MALLVLILGLLTAFGSLSIDMYLPAFPAIAGDLATDVAAVEASLALFFLGFSAGQMLYGPVSDRFGRKPPLYFGLALYTAASIGCALAWSIEALIAFRFLQALGGCAGVVVSRAVVRDRFDHNEAARMFSLLMLVMGVSPILAPLAGGYLAAGFGWRAIFVLLAGIGTAAAVLVHLRLDETLDPARATTALRPGLILRNYAIVVRDRHFLRYTLANSCALAGMFAYISGSPFVLIDLYGVSSEHYGVYFGANAFGLIGLSQFNRRLLRHFSFEAILPVAFGAMMACGLFLMVAGTLRLPLPWLAVGLFLFVSGIGLVGPNSAAGAMSNHPERAGSAAALYGTLQFSVAAAASGLVGTFHDGTARPMTWIIGLSSVGAFAIFVALKPRAARTATTPGSIAPERAVEPGEQ